MKTSIGWLTTIALFAVVNQNSAQLSFAPAANYPAGDLPYCLAAADVNRDGKVDLVVANQVVNTLWILTNSGCGVFGSNATLHTLSGLSSVAAADFNRDGNVDLACACSGAYELMVFTNDGSGAFEAKTSYHLGSGSSLAWVNAVDVNGDGAMDLITDNGKSLVVLTNAGNGDFAVAFAPSYGSFVPAAIADINGDGKIDLIGANAYELMILTNAGSGMFRLSSKNSLATSWPGNITTADIHGDGKVDIIVPDYNSGNNQTLLVLTNNGSGGLGSNAVYTVGLAPYSVISADLNGDGYADLISVNNRSDTLTILTNDGSGYFGSNVTLSVGQTLWPFPEIALAADINGDGKPDLISANIDEGTVSVLVNTSVFPSPTSIPNLNINRLSNAMIVSWPSDSAGWSLQQNSDLTMPDWSPSGYSGYPIADDGTNKSLFVTPPEGNLFFRLMHP
jgi:hypothetical protein